MVQTPDHSREIRVFLSSTFRDMEAERNHLVKQVFPKVRAACLARQVGFTEIDLRWGVTEEESKNGATVEICLKEIERCRNFPPFFIGFLGERYGWIPKHEDLAAYWQKRKGSRDAKRILNAVKRGISVTELEMELAVLEDGAADKIASHALFLLRDRTLTDSLYRQETGKAPNPADPAFYDPADGKLEVLKERIRRTPFLGTPDDKADYTTVEQFGEAVENYLLAQLDYHFPEDAVPTPLEQLQEAHAAFRYHRLQNFLPREDVRKQVIKALQKRLDTPHLGPVLLAGPSGQGKSVLMADLARHLESAHPEWIVLDHYFGTGNANSLDSWARRILETLHPRIQDLVGAVPETTKDQTEALSTWIAMACRRQEQTQHQEPGTTRLVLILDALDQCSGGGKELDLLKPELIGADALVVISAADGTPARDAAKDYETLLVPPLTAKLKVRMIRDTLARYRKKLTPELAQRLAEAPQSGSPLFLSLALEELRLDASHESLTELVADILRAKDAEELFLNHFLLDEDYGRAELPTLAAAFMALLGASRFGLTELELAELLASPDDPAVDRLDALRRNIRSEFSLGSDIPHDRPNGSEAARREQLKALIDVGKKTGFVTRSEIKESLSEYITGEEMTAIVAALREFGVKVPAEKKGTRTPMLPRLHLSRLLTNFGPFLVSKAGRKAPMHRIFGKAALDYYGDVPVREHLYSHFKKGYNSKDKGEFDHRQAAAALYQITQLANTEHDNQKYARKQLVKDLGMLWVPENLHRYSEEVTLSALSSLVKKEKQLLETYWQREIDGLDASALSNASEPICDFALWLYRIAFDRYQMPRKLLTSLLRQQIKIFGDYDQRIIRTAMTLGWVCESMGDQVFARSLSKLVLEIRERNSDADHIDTADALNNLAEFYREQGNPEEFSSARGLYERALAIREKNLGPVHRETGTSLSNLALYLTSTGNRDDFDAAKALYQRSLAIAEKTIDPDEPDMVAALHCWATYLTRTGNPSDFKEARPYYERVLATSERIYGPEHPDTAIGMNGLALYLAATGDPTAFDACIQLLERALAIRERSLAPDHPDIADSHIVLAECLLSTGIPENVATAVPLLKRGLGLLDSRAAMLEEAGCFGDAEPLRRRELVLLEKAAGPEHEETLHVLQNLAVSLRNVGRLVEAEALQREAVTRFVHAYGEDSVEAAVSFSAMGALLKLKGEFAEAEGYFLKALAIRERELGPDDKATTLVRSRLDELLIAKGTA